MTDAFVSWMIWWFALFGVNDWNYVKLGITLLATAALLTVLWLIVILFFAALGAVIEGTRSNRV